jgi:DNA-binding transcriptional LysR family regulator
VLPRADDAVAFTKAVAHRKRTHVRVGYSFCAAAELPSRALLAFQRTNPGVSADLSTMPTQDLLRGLRSGGLDPALPRYVSPENFQGWSVEELGTYPFNGREQVPPLP